LVKKAYRATGGFILLLLLFIPLPTAGQQVSVTDIEAYRLSFLPPMRAVEAELRGLFPPERRYECKCRLKKIQSIQEKIVRKRLAGIEDVTDIAGCRLSFPDLSRIPKVENTIQRRFRVVERENHLEDKRDSGYRAVHYLIEKNGKIVELQLRTFRQNIWGRLSHQWVYKGPYSKNKGVKRYLLNLSRAIYTLDLGEDATLPELPSDLPSDFHTAVDQSLPQLRAVGK